MQASVDTPTQNAPDAELLARFAASGDDPAFAELVRRHAPLVLAVTRRRLGGSGLAEDAAQQVFIALARRIKQLRGMPCLVAWLQKAAVYEAASIARREARHMRRVRHAGGVESDPDPPANEGGLDRALAALPERDRQILLLHHFEKFGYEQIAKRLGITAAAAQRRGHRALARLAALLKRRDADESACAVWLATGLAPRDTPVADSFVTRTLALKKPAAFAMPWIPIAASLVLGGGALVVAQKSSPPASPVTVAEPVAAAPRGEARKLRPHTPDDRLGEDFREFISRAKLDSRDAWEWVKARPDGPGSFLNPAVRHLADRDLAAAERLLDVVEGNSVRAFVIAGIFASRVEGSFEGAVVWIDSFPAADDRRATIYHGNSDFPRSDSNEHDYLGALDIARSPEVRQWLIREVYQRSRKYDESVIEKLAGQLQGEERRLALSCVASLRLQRNDPSGFAILDEIQPGDDLILYFPSAGELREFEPLCNWIAGREDGVDRSSIVLNLWNSWASRDAAAAAAWGMEMNRRGGFGPYRVKFSPIDPVTKRFMTEP